MYQYSKMMAELTSQRMTEATEASAASRYQRNSEKVPLRIKTLSIEQLNELKSVLSQHTHLVIRSQDEFVFQTYARVFNGSIQSPACLVVRPATTKDVSETVKFARRHGLSISARSGGHGVSGDAIRGDIIIDMGAMDSIEIAPPLRSGVLSTIKGLDYVSLRDRKQQTKLRNSPKEGWPNSPYVDHGRELQSYPDAFTSADYNALPQSLNLNSLNNMLSPFTPGMRTPLDSYYALSREEESDNLSGSSPVPRPDSGLNFASASTSMHSRVTTPSVFSDGDDSSLYSQKGKRARQPSFTTSEQSSSRRDPDMYSYMEGTTSSPPSSVSIPGSSYGGSGKRGSKSSTFRDISSLPPINQALPAPHHPEAQRQPFNFELQAPSLASTSTEEEAYAASFVQRFHSSYYREHDQEQDLSRRDSRQHPSGTSSNPSDIRGPRANRNFLFEPHSLSTLRTPATEVHVKDCQAFVIFGAGAQQKDIDLYTHSHPLPAQDMNKRKTAVPYHAPFATHPVGASAMLLAGFGFLSRLYGLATDNLVEVEMVLADGSIVYVSKKENEDLWWAIRGAGPAFGIATRFIAKAYPIPPVFAGSLVYNFRPTSAISLIKHVRDCVKFAPRELYVMILMTAGPKGQGSIIAISLCFTGSREKGIEFYDMIRAWDNGQGCLMNDVGTKLFLMQTGSVEKMLRATWGKRWFIRADLVTSLPDEVITKTVSEFVHVPAGCTWAFELAGGAIADTEDSCIPKSRRRASWHVTALHQWDIENEHPGYVNTAVEFVEEDLKHVSAGGPLPSFLARHEKAERVKGSYGENWERLKELKQKYDPDGVFTCSFWPRD